MNADGSSEGSTPLFLVPIISSDIGSWKVQFEVFQLYTACSIIRIESVQAGTKSFDIVPRTLSVDGTIAVSLEGVIPVIFSH